MEKITNYPVYVPSHKRAKSALTARYFLKCGTPFKLVIEPRQEDDYKEFKNHLILLDENNDTGSSLPVRNFISQHSISEGHKRHWQFDDNIRSFRRLHRGCRVHVNSTKAIQIVEEFTDRYTNIGVSGFDYEMFVVDTCKKPIVTNVHVYSACLINNEMPYRHRLLYNEDTDLCLQVVTNGLCTVQFKTLMVEKMRTMTMAGGNADQIYKGKGRLKMARSLEEVWPEHVETAWRFGRPQHRIKKNWTQFTTPLKRNPELDWDAIKNKRYSFKLKQVRETDCWQMKKYRDEQNEQN